MPVHFEDGKRHRLRVARPRHHPPRLASKEFEQKVEAITSPEAKASEMEHVIRHEIHIRLEENPAFYESLRERLMAGEDAAEYAAAPSTEIPAWTSKGDVQREMRQAIKRQLRAGRVREGALESLTASIMDVAKVRKGR